MVASLFAFAFLSYRAEARPKNILYVGDSHSVGEFGITLGDLLRKDPGSQVTALAYCGATAESWNQGPSTNCGYRAVNAQGKLNQGKKGRGPSLKDLVKKLQPDHLIVELGNNDVASGQNDREIEAAIDTLVSTVGASHCDWITGPDTRRFRPQGNREFRLIQNGTKGRCDLFNSQNVTHYPNGEGDGIHYNTPELKPRARAWAKAVFLWLEKH